MPSITCPYCGTEYFDGVAGSAAADYPGNTTTRQKHLPPDPENMNDHHARRAAAALRLIHASDYEAARPMPVAGQCNHCRDARISPRALPPCRFPCQ